MSNITSDKILIVDDQPANISLLTTILEEKGYQISAANTGEQAIVISNKMKPNLILLDIMMPGLDGFETCRRLKLQDETKIIPVIFISAKNEVEDVLMGLSVGGVDYINKPFYKEEVCARINNQLQIQSLHQTLIASESKMSRLLINYQNQSEKLQQIVDHVDSAIVEMDHTGKILFFNRAVDQLFGYSAEELDCINFFQLLVEPYASVYQKKIRDSHFDNQMEESLLENKTVEILAKKKNTHEFPIDFSFLKISVGKEVYLAVLQDISTRKEKEETLRHLSNTDSLTKLANRRYFEQLFTNEWQRNQRGLDNQNQLAFFMIDVDFFKQFNDTYGHQAGDDCLIKIADSLLQNTRRSGDVVARLGGEEFGVIVTESSKKNVIKLAEKIRGDIQALNIPHRCSEFEVVTISLGGVIRNKDDECNSCNSLYNKADKLMYQAKKSGKNQCIVV